MLRLLLILSLLLIPATAQAQRRAARISGGTVQVFRSQQRARGVNRFQTFGSVSSTGVFFNFSGRNNQFLPLNGAATPVLILR